MAISRRILLAVPALALAAPALAQGDWPSRPVRMIVPAPGGAGTADTVARIFAQEMEKRLPQRVVVDNRGGAAGNVGAAAAARSAPDGYTILWSWSGTLATNPAMYSDMPFDPQRDFAPVVLIGSVPNILIVNNDFPARHRAHASAACRRCRMCRPRPSSACRGCPSAPGSA